MTNESPPSVAAPAVVSGSVLARPRSSRAEVRNPMLTIPEVQAQWDTLPKDAKAALVAMLTAMSKTFRERGNTAWRKHKPPVAAYWKASAVNCRHLALAGRATMREDHADTGPRLVRDRSVLASVTPDLPAIGRGQVHQPGPLLPQRPHAAEIDGLLRAGKPRGNGRVIDEASSGLST